MQVDIESLRHTYAAPGLQDRSVLRIDRWSAESGSRWLLRGISGSGKTTLLNVVSGLLSPTSGRVRLDGEDIYTEREAEAASHSSTARTVRSSRPRAA